MHNLQRVKTQAEIFYESQYYLSLIPSEQGKRTDLIEAEDSNDAPEKGSNRFEKAAKMMDEVVSAQTIRRMHKVAEAEKKAEAEGNSELLELRLVEKIVAGEITPSNAENLLKNYNKYAKEREEEKDIQFSLPEGLDVTYQLFNESSERMAAVESESVQTVVTSCPYYDVRLYGNTTADKLELGHQDTPEEFVDSLMIHFREVARVLKSRGSFFLNFGEYGFNKHSPLISNMIVLRLYEEGLFKCINEIIFHKKNGKPEPYAANKRLTRSYEKIYHLVKNSDEYDYYPLKIWREEPMTVMNGFTNRGVDGKSTSSFSIKKPYTTFKDFIDEQHYEDVIHSAAANTSIYKRIDPDFDHAAPYDPKICVLPILTTSKPGDTVLDNFSGTASTGVAAISLGRNYIGYELNPQYHAFAQKRLPFDLSGYNKESIEHFENLKCD
jgi:DNA modification methylase